MLLLTSGARRWSLPTPSVLPVHRGVDSQRRNDDPPPEPPQSAREVRKMASEVSQKPMSVSLFPGGMGWSPTQKRATQTESTTTRNRPRKSLGLKANLGLGLI